MTHQVPSSVCEELSSDLSTASANVAQDVCSASRASIPSAAPPSLQRAGNRASLWRSLPSSRRHSARDWFGDSVDGCFSVLLRDVAGGRAGQPVLRLRSLEIRVLASQNHPTLAVEKPTYAGQTCGRDPLLIAPPRSRAAHPPPAVRRPSARGSPPSSRTHRPPGPYEAADLADRLCPMALEV